MWVSTLVHFDMTQGNGNCVVSDFKLRMVLVAVNAELKLLNLKIKSIRQLYSKPGYV